ncbi:MAG: CYTH domain-containing protein [Acidobacteriota bacterium]
MNLTATRAIVIGLCCTAAVAATQDEDDEQTSEFTAAGFDKLRIEREDKLQVPLEKADDVWAFLEDRYVKDVASLRLMDPEFTSYWHLEEFWDTYFDTPDFKLLGLKSGVRHRRRINHSAPSQVKSGRQLLQIKVNDPDPASLNRGEYKYAIEPLEKIRTFDDEHPVVGLVKRSQREEMRSRLGSMGIDPYALRPVLTVHDMRSRIYIKKAGQPFMSISFDRADTSVWWVRHRFIEIEPELNEIPYTDGSAETRAYMEKILEQVVADVRGRFPEIAQDLTPKYNKSFAALQSQLPVFPWLVRAKLNDQNGLVTLATVGVMLVGGAGFLTGRRTLARRRRGRAGHPPPLRHSVGP